MNSVENYGDLDCFCNIMRNFVMFINLVCDALVLFTFVVAFASRFIKLVGFHCFFGWLSSEETQPV